MAIRTILVATDFSESAKNAIDYAVFLAQTFSARLHLLHAYRVQSDLVLPGDLWERVEKESSRRLGETAREIASRGVEVEPHLSPHHPVRAISETAQETGADLVVMGTRGLSGLRHVVLGSVAEGTVRTAPCPVLTVRSDKE
jgi:nucleotide-binding universal stress UspA family protein